MDAPNPTAGASEPSKIGYPNSPCNKSGYQTVQEDPLHRIYWEEYGPADGEPVMFLHGGAGAGCQKFFTHFFNPERYRVILFDQRGQVGAVVDLRMMSSWWRDQRFSFPPLYGFRASVRKRSAGGSLATNLAALESFARNAASLLAMGK